MKCKILPIITFDLHKFLLLNVVTTDDDCCKLIFLFTCVVNFGKVKMVAVKLNLLKRSI